MLIATISFASFSFGVVFVTCDLGQRLTDAFDEICDDIVALKWNRFPLQIQRLLPTILIGTQSPVVLDCFGSISVLRDTFKKVDFFYKK